MKKSLAIALFSLIACGSSLAIILPIFGLQDVPQSPISGSGQIQSREFGEPVREGNTIVATDFVTLDYDVTWELRPTGEFSDPKTWQCVTIANRCKGGKHATHDACDTSCCVMDNKEHKAVLRGKYKPDYNAMRDAERDSAKGAIASGGTADPRDWSSGWTDALSQAKALAKETVTIPVGPFKKPCTTQLSFFGLRKYEFYVTGAFTRNIRRVSGGKEIGTRTEPGASHSKVVAEVWLPEKKPLNVREEVACFCKVKKEDPPCDPPPTENVWKELWCPFPTWEYGGECVPEQPKECQVTFTGNGLTSVHCELMNMGDETCTVTFPAGTTCTPNDDKYQVMSTKHPSTISCPPQMHMTFNIPATCTQIDKKEPTENVKFSIGYNFDSGLSSILRGSYGSPMPPGVQLGMHMVPTFTPDPERAAVTQSKIWIYKDGSTFDKINKILFPGVTESQYLDALYGVGQQGGINLTDSKWKACFEPKLALGWSASSDATSYLVETVDDLDPTSFSHWMSTVVNRDFEEALRDNTSGKLRQEHVADLTSSIFESTNPKTRAAGIDFFNRIDPTLQETLVEAGALDGIENCLRSKNNKEVLESFKLVSRFGTGVNDRLSMIHGYFKDIFQVNGATPEIRKAAGGN